MVVREEEGSRPGIGSSEFVKVVGPKMAGSTDGACDDGVGEGARIGSCGMDWID